MAQLKIKHPVLAIGSLNALSQAQDEYKNRSRA